jgi:hypothetical protein
MSAAVAASLVFFDIDAGLLFRLVAVTPGAAGNSISFATSPASGLSSTFQITISGAPGGVFNVLVFYRAGDSPNVGALMAALNADTAFTALVTIAAPLGSPAYVFNSCSQAFLSGGRDGSGLGSYAF